MPVRANFTPFNLLAERLAEIHGLAVKVGCVGPKAGELEADSDLTLAELWQIHEYGTEDGHIPERAPLRKTFVARKDELAAVYRSVAAGVLKGLMTPRQALGLLGLRAASMVKATISSGVEPANAPSTIRRKKSSKPLIDHGQLWRSVDYEVTDAEGKTEAAAVALPAVATEAA